jgi:site-specific recombinase XerD
MISITFFIKSQKKNKREKIPVFIKIYRSASDFTTMQTKVRVSTDDWDGTMVLDTNEFHKEYNAMLSKAKSDLLLLGLRYPEDSCALLKEHYIGMHSKKYSIGEIISEYIKARLEDPEMSNEETRRTYRTHLKALTKFLKATRLYSHPADKFAYREGSILYNSILKEPKSVIYANKLMWKVKSSVQWGIGMRMIRADLIGGMKLKSIAHKNITSNDFFTIEEVVRFVSAEVPARYHKAKMLATLQIFTGMAYVDASSFNPKKVSISSSGRQTLVGLRTKTGHEYIIPLNMVAVGVIESYEWWGLKRIANCTYNDHLKIIAAYAGIKKDVTTHFLRRTFTQNMRDAGLTDEVIAKMCGWVDTRMLKFYSVVSEHRVLKEYEEKIAA